MKWYEAKDTKNSWQKYMYGKNSWYEEWEEKRGWIAIVNKLEWHVKHYLKLIIDAVFYPGAVVNSPTASSKSRATCVVLHPAQVSVENSPITDSFLVRFKCQVLHGTSKKIVSTHYHIGMDRLQDCNNIDSFIKSQMEFIAESILDNFKLRGNIDDV